MVRGGWGPLNLTQPASSCSAGEHWQLQQGWLQQLRTLATIEDSQRGPEYFKHAVTGQAITPTWIPRQQQQQQQQRGAAT